MYISIIPDLCQCPLAIVNYCTLLLCALSFCGGKTKNLGPGGRYCRDYRRLGDATRHLLLGQQTHQAMSKHHRHEQQQRGGAGEDQRQHRQHQQRQCGDTWQVHQDPPA